MNPIKEFCIATEKAKLILDELAVREKMGREKEVELIELGKRVKTFWIGTGETTYKTKGIIEKDGEEIETDFLYVYSGEILEKRRSWANHRISVIIDGKIEYVLIVKNKEIDNFNNISIDCVGEEWDGDGSFYNDELTLKDCNTGKSIYRYYSSKENADKLILMLEKAKLDRLESTIQEKKDMIKELEGENNG